MRVLAGRGANFINPNTSAHGQWVMRQPSGQRLA